MQLRLIAPWLVLLGACSSGGTNPPAGSEPQVVPEFLLTDVNTTSPTYDQDVSPRDSLGLVTAWYFSKAT
ncbi:MAG: hypothetical protein ACYTDU_01450 [Planctomycetota bacterium]|jgi:hypothetical protein